MTGTHNQGFDRLIKAVDRLAENFEEKFFIQTGNSEVKPENCEWKKFLSESDRIKKIAESSVVITHGGSGSIIDCLKNGKKTIVVPREKKFKEHVNNHQFELAEALGRQGKIVACSSLEELDKAIEKAGKINTEIKSRNTGIIKEIEDFLGE
ncbi:MAG: PssE/Cps14G family polysaccharide biosynthesis glycosyltransferase [archaeon]